MKCIRSKETGKVMRVQDEKAKFAVDRGVANYVSKSTWKKEVRDVSKSV